jgi:hypothetical protein
MATKQGLDAPRLNAFSYAPEDLTLITTESDPLYDERVELEVPDGAVLDCAALGIKQNCQVRKEGDDVVVLDGHQRVKRALVVNALLGEHYSGPIKAVRDAIKRLGGSEIAKRVVELRGESGPVRVPVTLDKSKTTADAYGVKSSLNSWRAGESKQHLIAKVHRMANEHDLPREVIAARTGLSLATVGRYLKADPNAAPKARKPMSAKRKPGAKKLNEVFIRLPKGSNAKMVLGWVMGEVPAAHLVEMWPDLRAVL